jgi:hypothetical protein
MSPDTLAYLTMQLWDLWLVQTYERQPEKERVLGTVLSALEPLGFDFYPNDSSFTLLHLLTRTQQMTLGLWPPSSLLSGSAGELASGSEILEVQRSILRACHGSTPALIRGYETLIFAAGRAPGFSPEQSQAVSGSAFRCGLLKSLVLVCKLAEEELEVSIGSGAGGGGWFCHMDQGRVKRGR